MKNYITYIIIALAIFMCSKSKAQTQMGYVTGFTKQGINPAAVQPIYGITLQKQLIKYVALESDVIYSQRMNGHNIQADYLQFMIMGKFGYFGNKAGIYGGYGFSLNPTLDHSNPENHTYVSFIPSIGCQLNLFPKTIVELKSIYDIGLMSGYYIPGTGWGIVTKV